MVTEINNISSSHNLAHEFLGSRFYTSNTLQHNISSSAAFPPNSTKCVPWGGELTMGGKSVRNCGTVAQFIRETILH